MLHSIVSSGFVSLWVTNSDTMLSRTNAPTESMIKAFYSSTVEAKISPSLFFCYRR